MAPQRQLVLRDGSPNMVVTGIITVKNDVAWRVGANEYAFRLIAPMRVQIINQEIGSQCYWKKPRLCKFWCEWKSVFSNPQDRSPRCQPELSYSPLARLGTHADKHKATDPHMQRDLDKEDTLDLG